MIPDLPEWHDHAACRNLGPLIMFPAAERRDDPNTQAALAVCRTCPVEDLCLTEGLTYPLVEDHGIRGGLTATERRRIRRHIREGMTPEDAVNVAVRGREARSTVT